LALPSIHIAVQELGFRQGDPQNFLFEASDHVKMTPFALSFFSTLALLSIDFKITSPMVNYALLDCCLYIPCLLALKNVCNLAMYLAMARIIPNR